MANTVKAVPEGLHTITPYLVVKDAEKAIAFYKKAYGAQELNRMPGPDGRSIFHAHLRIGHSALFLADEAVTKMKSPASLGGCPMTIQLNVEDAHASFKRATEAGAKVVTPIADMFWGDRYGQVEDPFGFRWGISQRVKEMTPQEMAKAAEAAHKQSPGAR